MSIVFLRHAATEYNQTNRWLGKTDQALSEEGFRQAERVAKELSVIQFDAVYVSSLKRAVQTAEIVLKHQPVPGSITLVPDLQERGFGQLEGCIKNEDDRRLMDHLSTVEPLWEFRARLIRALTSINGAGDSILVVSHSTVFSTLVKCGYITPEPIKFRLKNAEWVRIKMTPA